MANRWGKNGSNDRLYFLGIPKSLQMVTVAVIIKDACSWEGKAVTNLDRVLKSRDIILPTKVRIVKAIVFSVACTNVRVGP